MRLPRTKKAFRSCYAPGLGLEMNINFLRRVYVLRRAAQNAIEVDKDFWYVGISPRNGIADRIKKHFSKGGDSFYAL